MTDLEQLIKFLEERKKLFESDAESGGREPDGLYATRDMNAINRKLRILKKLHPDSAAILKIEDIVGGEERRIRSINQILLNQINELSDKKLSLDDYEKELSLIIKTHLRWKQAMKNIELRDLDSLDNKKEIGPRKEIKTTGLKQDKIYELAEDLYDYRISSFEIRFQDSNLSGEFYLRISSRQKLILFQFMPSTTSTQNKPFITQSKNYGFDRLLFEKIEDIWTCTHNREIATFNMFITNLSRILFEIVGVTNQLLEVRYTEYD